MPVQHVALGGERSICGWGKLGRSWAACISGHGMVKFCCGAHGLMMPSAWMI